MDGSVLRELREKRDVPWDQGEVAQMVGLSAEHYNRLEMGMHTPRNKTLRKLAALFGITVADLRDRLSRKEEG